MRVIQDSDDDSDGDIEVNLPQQKTDASPNQLTSASAEQSSHTGSTESLKRAIETAHRAHFQFDRKEPHSSMSLPEPGDKRTSLSDGVVLCAYSGVGGSNAPVTHAKIASTIATTSLTNLAERAGSNPTPEELEPTLEGNWMPDGTLRHDYAQHNPFELFPEASSTVPNATLTQQRIMDAFAAPISSRTGNEADQCRYQPEPSIPWSEFMMTSPEDNHEQRSSEQQEQAPELEPANNIIPEPQITQEAPTLQWSQQSLSLVGDAFSVDRTSMQNGTAQNDFGYTEVATQPQDTGLSKSSDQAKTAPSKSQRNSQGQLSTSRRRPRQSQKSSAPISDDELADVNLPVEQYKPRPSRSRSLKVGTQEDVNYSVGPEKAARGAKRRKTTPANASVHEDTVSTAQKFQQICDMGFTPSTTGEALKLNGNDVTQTVDWLITNEVTADDLASPNHSRGKPTAPTNNHESLRPEFDGSTSRSSLNAQDRQPENAGSKAMLEVMNGVSTIQDTMNNDTALLGPDVRSPASEVKSPVKVQVVIPAKPTDPVVHDSSSLQAPSRKAKRRKTTLDQPEAVLNNDDAVKQIPEKKRSQGRPKKSVNASASTDMTQEDRQKEPPNTTLQIVETDTTDVVADTGASEASACLSHKAATSANPSITNPEPIPLPTRPEVPSITPERTNKLAKRDQSASSGKVPYRVGLSKRARIAPLLRTMRK